MKCIKGVIFDFNGTLFFDSDMHYEAWRIFSEKLRGYPFTDEEMRLNMFGRTNADIIEYALKRKPDEELVRKLAYEKEAWYRQMCLDNPERFVLSPGSENFLNFLKENDIPRTIATMSEKDNVDFYIKEFKLERWFDIDKIVYSDGTIPGKPAPDIYLKAAANINTPPSDCLVFEDALSGLNAAKNAGIGTIIAIASVETDDFYKSVPFVKQIIRSFDETDVSMFEIAGHVR